MGESFPLAKEMGPVRGLSLCSSSQNCLNFSLEMIAPVHYDALKIVFAGNIMK